MENYERICKVGEGLVSTFFFFLFFRFFYYDFLYDLEFLLVMNTLVS